MSKLIDMTGQDFGYWHVIERAENDKRGKARWLCKCTACNKTIKSVDGTHLRSGRSTNCGCIRNANFKQRSMKHEEGKDYGFLHVEREATEEEKPRHDRTGVYWNCTCTKCGRKNVIIFGDYLRNGDTQSCGCLNSKNESKICQMLDTMNIKYQQQISFQDLTSTGRACDKLLFDVGIYNQNQLLYLIEYDGIQHFEEGHFKDTFQVTHQNDLLKNKYCFEHKIPLIRIPYNKEYILNDLKLETTRFLLTPENEQIYYDKYKNQLFLSNKKFFAQYGSPIYSRMGSRMVP